MTDILKSCTWEYQGDEYNYWETLCGHAFQLVDGSPSDNGMNFCPYCGQQLIENLSDKEENDAN